MNQPLKGLKVLDLSMGVAGPHAGMLCARHGADVVKLEPPHGDWGRTLGPTQGDLSAYASTYNRGKRSIALDLKDPQARAVLAGYAAQADVVIQAFRPGVVDRLGLGYDTLRQKNPRLIYLSVSGFGQAGPLIAQPATDAVMQGFSGFMFLNKNRQGTPQRVDMVLLDVVTGLYGFQAIAMALIERGISGTGSHIDCSLLKAAMAFQAPKMVDNLMGGGVQTLYVPLGVMPTRDGHVSISVMHDYDFVALCEAIERPDLARDAKFDSRAKRIAAEAELMPILQAEFAGRSTEDLVRRLTRADIRHSTVNTYPELLAHEQVEAAQAVEWIRPEGISMALPFPAIPGAPAATLQGDAPHTGQHTVEILREWGVPADALQALVDRGAAYQYASDRPPKLRGAGVKADAAPAAS